MRPLSHRGSDGQVYRRRPGIERQIEELVALPVAVLRERAAITRWDDPLYVQDESLVYLLREAQRTGTGAGMPAEELAEVLLGRCYSIARPSVYNLGADGDDALQDITARVFGQILDLDSDRGDYLQVSFGSFVKARAIDTFLHYSRRQNRESQVESWESFADQASNLKSAAAESPEQSLLELEERATAAELLRAVGEPYCTAYRLRYIEGWPIFDQDPSKPCLSRHFGVNQRTIQNWFRRTEQRVLQLREGRP